MEKSEELNEKNEAQPKNAIDGTHDIVRTAEKRFLLRKLLTTPVKFQESPRKDMSPNKRQLKGPGSKYASASEKARKQQVVHDIRN